MCHYNLLLETVELRHEMKPRKNHPSSIAIHDLSICEKVGSWKCRGKASSFET